MSARFLRDYYKCRKCNCFIPYYTLSQHGEQCHEHSSQISSLKHPFIFSKLFKLIIY